MQYRLHGSRSIPEGTRVRQPRHDTILVIDDDRQVGDLLLSLLERAGYRPEVATSGEEGLAAAATHKPALILLDMVMPGMDGFEVCNRLSQDVSLKHIPVIVLTGHGSARDRLPEVIHCIDDYVFKPFDPQDLTTRIELSLRRSRSMGGANPLTRLPGNVAIQEELMDRIDQNSRFALLHIDLDEFKAFNDHYGFLRGDEAIKLLARCAREAVSAHPPGTGFVGHIGGDDLVAVVGAEHAAEVAGQIVRSWDDRVPNLYEPEDADRGFIELVDRRGQLQRFPMVSVSIGVASNAIRPLHSHWEASEVAAEMKHVAKSHSGSTIAIDRRREISLDDVDAAQAVASGR